MVGLPEWFDGESESASPSRMVAASGRAITLRVIKSAALWDINGLVMVVMAVGLKGETDRIRTRRDKASLMPMGLDQAAGKNGLGMEAALSVG
jgi:hypothetical protein